MSECLVLNCDMESLAVPCRTQVIVPLNGTDCVYLIETKSGFFSRTVFCLFFKKLSRGTDCFHWAFVLLVKVFVIVLCRVY